MTTPTVCDGSAVAQLRHHRRVDVDADDAHPRRQHVADADAVQHRRQHQHQLHVRRAPPRSAPAPRPDPSRVRQRPVVADAAGEHEVDAVRARTRTSRPTVSTPLSTAARMPPARLIGVDRAHVIAVALLDRRARSQIDAERRAEERELDVVHGERVARQHHVSRIRRGSARRSARRRRCGRRPGRRRRRCGRRRA